MKTVILVYPKIEYEANYPNTWIPYSILSIASVIHNSDVKVLMFDENITDSSEFDALIEKNINDCICVGFSIMTGGGQIHNAINLAKKVKSIDKNIPIVFGGPHVNVLPKETLCHPLIDIVLKGNGQYSFPYLLQYLDGKIQAHQVPNMYYKNSEGNVFISSTSTAQNLILPRYNFDLLDLNNYIQQDKTIAPRTLNYIASQGCAYMCKFCYETSYKRKYYKIATQDVLEDIDYFIDRYQINGIKFYDADFFIDYKRAILIANKLKENNIKWAASIHPRDILRAQKDTTNNLLETLAESGCTRLLMGIESGCNRILKDVVNKMVTKEEIYQVAKLIAHYGILGSYTFIIGFPGEIESEQKETFDFITKLWELSPKPETRVHIYTPYPGTELYDKAISLGFNPPEKLEDWSNFDYYKSQIPWTDKTTERNVDLFTSMIVKN